MLMAATEPSRAMRRLSSSLYEGFSAKVLMHSGSALPTAISVRTNSCHGCGYDFSSRTVSPWIRCSEIQYVSSNDARNSSFFFLHGPMPRSEMRLEPSSLVLIWLLMVASRPSFCLAMFFRSPRVSAVGNTIAFTPPVLSTTTASASSTIFCLTSAAFPSVPICLRSSPTIGATAWYCCLMPPGQSSRSVAPIRGRVNSIASCFLPSADALLTASAACPTCSRGDFGSLGSFSSFPASHRTAALFALPRAEREAAPSRRGAFTATPDCLTPANIIVAS
mmetsp:Transcript_3776/g.10264  ORF Transcript_3776/g.10264 Transcript_3776/m.10264 type:complete len:278 (-) Transcript_3776:27-860(-)